MEEVPVEQRPEQGGVRRFRSGFSLRLKLILTSVAVSAVVAGLLSYGVYRRGCPSSAMGTPASGDPVP